MKPRSVLEPTSPLPNARNSRGIVPPLSHQMSSTGLPLHSRPALGVFFNTSLQCVECQWCPPPHEGCGPEQGNIKPRTREVFITPAWACAKHCRSVHFAMEIVCATNFTHTPPVKQNSRVWGQGEACSGSFERVRTPCREWRCQTM